MSKRPKDIGTLLKENRDLRNENRNLKRALNRANKQLRRIDVVVPGEDDVEEEELDTLDLSCERCGKKVNIVDIGVRTLHICEDRSCKHRKSIKK